MGDQPTREELIRQLQEIAARLSVRSLSQAQYIREGGVNEYQMLKHFDSWNALVVAAGLEPTSTSRLDDDDLWTAMCDAFVRAEGIVTRARFRKFTRYSESAYVKRWGR